MSKFDLKYLSFYQSPMTFSIDSRFVILAMLYYFFDKKTVLIESRVLFDCCGIGSKLNNILVELNQKIIAWI